MSSERPGQAEVEAIMRFRQIEDMGMLKGKIQ
jgi:hypothetical protein